MDRCIFLNYRREDTAGYAGHLAGDLRSRLEGDTRIIMDVDTFGPGDLFAESIDRALYACDAFISLIGRRWLEPDSTGRRRIDDEQDWVRIELGIALKRKIRVIPVLVDGAALPSRADLPADLSRLTEHQALTLDNSTWQLGMDRLVNSISMTGTASYPVLALSAERVDFGTVAQNAPSPEQSVRLINEGMGQLNASASADLPWLIVSTRQDAVDLRIDTSQPGDYAGEVVVRSAGGTERIPVSATVTPEHREAAPPERTTPQPSGERREAVARWVTLGLLAFAVVVQLASITATHAAIHAGRPNLPDADVWATLVWLLPLPLLVVAAWLVAARREAGIALGCVTAAMVWVLTSVALGASRPGSLVTFRHYLTLILVVAAICALVVAAPELRERVRRNSRGRMIAALVLLAVAVILRVDANQIASAITHVGSTDAAKPWGNWTTWPDVILPVVLCVPAAVFLCNRAQTRALLTLAYLLVLYEVVVRSLTYEGALNDRSHTQVSLSLATYIVGTVCILLAVYAGQRRATER